MNIYVFYHVSTVRDWKSIVKEQLDCVRDSGLLDACEHMYIGHVGEGVENLVDHVRFFYESWEEKYTIENNHHNRFVNEWPTLKKLWISAKNEDAKFLYIHSKGVRMGGPNPTDWRRLMMYFNVERWNDCVEALDSHDMCGVNWVNVRIKHFSGNFWWATSKYIKRLRDPENVGHKSKVDIEFWSASGKPNVKCLHQSKVNHYKTPYPRQNYEVTKK